MSSSAEVPACRAPFAGRQSRGSLAGLLALGAALVVSVVGLGEDEEPPRPTLRAVRVERRPTLDGDMGDEAWREAPVGGPLVQAYPEEGVVPTERTEFRVVYDADALVIGVWCFDSDPGAIVASEMARDGRSSFDDHVAIALDTFLDRRNGYLFRVNPNGARDDALIVNNTSLNENWDGIWRARARVDEAGWFLELEIPFKALGFDPDSTTWGLNVSRLIRRRNEVDRWAGAEQRLRDYSLSEAGDLTGLEGLQQGLGMSVTPYALARYRDERDDDDVDRLFEAGVDARYAITPNLRASLSYNTDFAETEVDERQINLTRFPLFFPEKRDFFLEDGGIFEFGKVGTAMVPFFSRRIGLSNDGEPVPITLASKLTGRIDEYNVGAIDALLESHDDLPARNAFVGRVSRNVLESSSVGGILTHGDPNSRDENLLGGVDFNYHDTRLVPGWALDGTAFLAATWTEDVEGSDNLSFGANLTAERDVLYTSLRVFQIERNFNPALGFVPRKDIRTYELEATTRPLVESVSWIRRIFVSYFQRHVTDLDDELETALHSLTPLFVELETGDEIFFNTQTHFDEPVEDFEIHPGVVIPPDEYWFQVHRVGFNSAGKRVVDGRFIWEFGDFYDGHKNTFDAQLSVKPSKHLIVSATYILNRIRLPEGDFETRLASARVQVSFTPDLIWRNLVQYDDLSDTIGLNSRLSWEFRPGSNLYAVVTQNADRNHGRLRVERTEATVKVGLALLF